MYYYTEYITICTSRSQVEHANLITEPLIIYIDIEGTTPNFFSQKSWYLGILNGSIARGFGKLNHSIEQKIKNLQLETCRYITDIKITFWDCTVFSLKSAKNSFHKIFSLKVGQVGCKRQKKIIVK